MSKSIPNYLRLYTERPGQVAAPSCEALRSLPDLCRAFEEATGWSLRYIAGQSADSDPDLLWSAPVDPGVGTPPGHLRIDLGGAVLAESGPCVDLDDAIELASAIAELLEISLRTQQALWQREAELATGVPLVPHRDERQHLAQRLESVLKSGAQAVGCQAGALYVLDSATTELKLRAAWGLPLDRFLAPARPLAAAKADLEALAGHAVVLDCYDSQGAWNVPEDYPAAVCVPISSATTPLGTLWLFSESPRGFHDAEVSVVEVVAGRFAAELEREVLLAEGLAGAHLKRQLTVAERMQQNQLPRVAPLLEGWELAGWTQQAQQLGGGFHDWFLRDDDRLVVTAGACLSGGVEAALSASGVRAALRAHGEHASQPHELLERVNRTLWTGSAGDQYASLFCGYIDTATGRFAYAAAGQPLALWADANDCRSLVEPSPLAGQQPSAGYKLFERAFYPGTVLVLTSESVARVRDQDGRPFGELLQDVLPEHLQLPARQLAKLLQDRLMSHSSSPLRDDRSILVVRFVPDQFTP